MKRIITWLRVKHTTLTQAAGVILGAGQVLGWWTLTADRIGAILALFGVLWLVIGAPTNTSNLRLTGRAFASPSGVDPDHVAAIANIEVGPIPDVYAPVDEVDVDAIVRDAGLD